MALHLLCMTGHTNKCIEYLKQLLGRSDGLQQADTKLRFSAFSVFSCLIMTEFLAKSCVVHALVV